MFRLPVELRALVDIHDQPFFVIDDEHRVVVVNRAFENAFGLTNAAATGTLCHRLMVARGGPCPCGTAGETCGFEDVLASGVTRISSCRYRDDEGREHLARAQAYPLRTESGRVYLGVLLQRDAMRDHPPEDTAECRHGMIGDSPAIRQTLARLVAAARSDAPVLLLGETGTGKELAANFLHRHSKRSAGPFHILDCSALAGELFESEVFGHARGAFTGSVGDKRGMFELADGGTLFLDEIGEMPLPLQSKLLRVLESGEFRRVGGVKTQRADVRIVCATNRELQGAPWFRSDLYFRIACITIRMPRLAERRCDIPLLTAELLQRIGRSSGFRNSIDTAALQFLAGYDFPGNIRELRNLLWAAAINSKDGRIGVAELQAALPGRCVGTLETPERPRGDAPTRGTVSDVAGLGFSIHRVWDAESFASALQRHSGNRRAVARELGVSERTVYRKLREFGLS